jgi:alkanesulfonate monooxygenase SsuD/methylene tetrahydromethanopterin reductase-like flavin-dependent oxidoreductase (luciferase family)
LRQTANRHARRRDPRSPGYFPSLAASQRCQSGREPADPRQIGRFVEGLAKGAPAVELISDSVLDALAIAGTPEQCREHLARLVAAGVTHPTIILPFGSDYDAAVRDLSKEVLSHFL